jgi:hypothetical protein
MPITMRSSATTERAMFARLRASVVGLCRKAWLQRSRPQQSRPALQRISARCDAVLIVHQGMVHEPCGCGNVFDDADSVRSKLLDFTCVGKLAFDRTV